VHTHILETKIQAVTGPAFYNQSLIEYVNELGLLNSRLTIAHAIWVTDAEIELMANAGVSISHNPISNLRLSSGIMPMRKLMDAGINLALGTDGMTNIDMQNVFAVMKFAALLPKIANPDYARYPTSGDILRIATHGGARSTLTEKEVGCLAEGYKADLVLLRKRSFPFIPLNDLKNQLVYAENGNSVDTVFINGQIIVQEGKILTVDEEAIIQEMEAILPEMHQKYAQVRTDQQEVMPYLAQAYKQAVIQDIGLNRFTEPLEEWANRIAAEVGLIPEKVVKR
jgi:cytosine/adenosine deaminase-related metal-dependent hydrolase